MNFSLIHIKRRLKKKYLKIFKKNIYLGTNVVIDPSTVIHNKTNRLYIGESVYLRSISKGYHAGMPFPTTILLDVKGSIVRIGDNTRINGAYIHAKKSISIGNSCVIASGVNILDSNGHMLKSDHRTIHKDKPKEIIIEDNVWIGLNAIVLKGTHIGKNSIVAAGSVVQGTFPPNSIIEGNKAKIVGMIV